MLVVCPALKSVRKRLVKFWFDRSAATPALLRFMTEIVCSQPHDLTQFILDPSQFPAILAMWSTLGQDIINHIYYLTRTFAYYMHREKLILLGRWPGDPGRKQKLITKQKTDRLTKNGALYLDKITHCSVTGSSAAPLAVSCTTASATTTTSTPASVQPQYQHATLPGRTTLPGCTTAMCTNLPYTTQAHSVHACIGTAGHQTNDGHILQCQEQQLGLSQAPLQPDVLHGPDLVCGAESDVRAAVSCANSQHHPSYPSSSSPMLYTL